MLGITKMVQAHPIIETSPTTAKLILNVITEKLHKTCPRHHAWRDWVTDCCRNEVLWLDNKHLFQLNAERKAEISFLNPIQLELESNQRQLFYNRHFIHLRTERFRILFSTQ